MDHENLQSLFENISYLLEHVDNLQKRINLNELRINTHIEIAEFNFTKYESAINTLKKELDKAQDMITTYEKLKNDHLVFIQRLITINIISLLVIVIFCLGMFYK